MGAFSLPAPGGFRSSSAGQGWPWEGRSPVFGEAVGCLDGDAGGRSSPSHPLGMGLCVGSGLARQGQICLLTWGFLRIRFSRAPLLCPGSHAAADSPQWHLDTKQNLLPEGLLVNQEESSGSAGSWSPAPHPQPCWGHPLPTAPPGLSPRPHPPAILQPPSARPRCSQHGVPSPAQAVSPGRGRGAPSSSSAGAGGAGAGPQAERTWCPPISPGEPQQQPLRGVLWSEQTQAGEEGTRHTPWGSLQGVGGPGPGPHLPKRKVKPPFFLL